MLTKEEFINKHNLQKYNITEELPDLDFLSAGKCSDFIDNFNKILEEHGDIEIEFMFEYNNGYKDRLETDIEFEYRIDEKYNKYVDVYQNRIKRIEELNRGIDETKAKIAELESM